MGMNYYVYHGGEKLHSTKAFLRVTHQTKPAGWLLKFGAIHEATLRRTQKESEGLAKGGKPYQSTGSNVDPVERDQAGSIRREPSHQLSASHQSLLIRIVMLAIVGSPTISPRYHLGLSSRVAMNNPNMIAALDAS